MRLKIYLASTTALVLFLSPNSRAQKIDEGASHIYISQSDRAKLDRLTAKANAGNAHAQFDLAQIYEKGAMGIKKDIAYAMSWYEEAARNGHRSASERIRRLQAHAASSAKRIK